MSERGSSKKRKKGKSLISRLREGGKMFQRYINGS